MVSRTPHDSLSRTTSAEMSDPIESSYEKLSERNSNAAWSTITAKASPAGRPSARAFMASTLFENFFFIWGGQSEVHRQSRPIDDVINNRGDGPGDLNDLWALDIETLVWHELRAGPPLGAAHAAMITFNTRHALPFQKIDQAPVAACSVPICLLFEPILMFWSD